MQDPRGGPVSPDRPFSMSGWLSKKSRKTKGLFGGGGAWKRGFWILNAEKQTFEEYSNERGDNFVSDVDLKDLAKVKKEGLDKIHLIFRSADDDPFLLQAETESMRNRWFNALSLFVAQKQTNQDEEAGKEEVEPVPSSSSAKKKKKMSIIGDVKKGLSAFTSPMGEKTKPFTSGNGGVLEKKRSFVLLGRKSNLAAQAEQKVESTNSRFSLTNPAAVSGRSSEEPADTVRKEADPGVNAAISSASLASNNAHRTAQSLSTASAGTTATATSTSRPVSMRKKRDSTTNQIDMTKSFMSKARNFAISINKDFIESVKKKGAYIAAPSESGDGERSKQRAAVVPVMAPEEKVDRARFKKTPQQNEMLLNLVLKEFAGFFGGDLLKQVDSQSIVDLMFLVNIPKDSVVVQQGEPTDRMYVIESGKVGVYTHDFVDRPPELEVERTQGDTFGVLSLIYNEVAPFMIKTHMDCQLWALPSRKFHELTTSETRRRLARKMRLLDRVPLIADNVDSDAIAQLADSMEFKEYQQNEVVLKRGDALKQILVIGEGEARLTAGTATETSILHKGDVFGEWTLLGRDFKSEFTIEAISPTLTLLCLDAEDVEELLGPLREFIVEKWFASKQQQQQQQISGDSPRGESGNRPSTPTAPLVEVDVAGGGVPTKLSGSSAGATKGSLNDGPKLSMRKQSSMIGMGGKRSIIIRASSNNENDVVPPPLPPSRNLHRQTSDLPPSGDPHQLFSVKKSAILKHAMSYESMTKEEEQQALEEVAREVMKSEDLLRRTKAARGRNTQTHLSFPDSTIPAEPLNMRGASNSESSPLRTSGTGQNQDGDDEDADVNHSENLDRPFIREKHLRPDVTTDNLKFCALLGSGNFGKVHLVQNENRPEELFALKVLVRHYIVLNGWEKMVENERDAMLELSTLVQSPFLLKLYNSFSDSKNIYLLLELCEGGDLYNLMRATRAKKFGQDTARFYFACVVMGLEAMHSRDIVYRDLKPENLMIDHTGYIKVADFGLAKKTLRTFTVCGTPEYMTPETILSRGHGMGVDWWAAGILLFEIIHGTTPFCGGESMEVYEKILAHKDLDDIEFPPPDETEMSLETKDLIKQLLHPKKNKRLGVKYPGIDGVKSHDFFKGFSWDEVTALEMAPPLVPSTAHIKKLLDDSANGKPYDPKLWGAPDDHSGWTLSF